MGHTVKYDNDRAKAVNDIREYVGNEFFENIDGMLREAIKTGEILDYEHFAFTLFMFPVSGYPIKAWWETINGEERP